MSSALMDRGRVRRDAALDHAGSRPAGSIRNDGGGAALTHRPYQGGVTGQVTGKDRQPGTGKSASPGPREHASHPATGGSKSERDARPVARRWGKDPPGSSDKPRQKGVWRYLAWGL